MSQWKSMHIFYHDILYKELLLCNVIAEYLDKLKKEHGIEKWFFINYWEGGPHIRVRIKGISEEKYNELENKIKEFMNLNKSRFVVTKEQYYKNNKFDGEEINESELPWYEDGSIKEIAYVPELKRYGGEKAIDLAEDMFCISSEVAVLIITATINNFNKRFGVAIDLFLETLQHTGCLNNKFVGLYSKWWGSYLGEDKGIIKKQVYDVISNKVNKSLNGELNKGVAKYYSECINLYFEKIKKIGIEENIACNIIASQMHMMDNRLSVTPEYEYVIAESILRKLNEKVQ